MYKFGCHPAGTKMEAALAFDTKGRREYALKEGPVDHDWTKPGGRKSEGGFMFAMPTDAWKLGVRLQKQSEEALGGPMALMFCSEFKEWFERIPIGTNVRLRGMTGKGAKFNGNVGVIQRSLPIATPCCCVVLPGMPRDVVVCEVRACELLRPSNAIARRSFPTGTN